MYTLILILLIDQDLPEDRTGELHNLLSFIHNNLDLCKWAALAIFATQVTSSPSIILFQLDSSTLLLYNMRVFLLPFMLTSHY